MNKQMDESDTYKAAVALSRWFESQKIDPADGVLIMTKLIRMVVHDMTKNRVDEKNALSFIAEMFEP